MRSNLIIIIKKKLTADHLTERKEKGIKSTKNREHEK